MTRAAPLPSLLLMRYPFSSVTVRGTATRSTAPSSHCGSGCAHAPASGSPSLFTDSSLSSASSGTLLPSWILLTAKADKSYPCERLHVCVRLLKTSKRRDFIDQSIFFWRLSAPLISTDRMSHGFVTQSSLSSAAHSLGSILRRSLSPLSQHIRWQRGFTTVIARWSVIFAPPPSPYLCLVFSPRGAAVESK